ncbi:MAG TPA: acetyl-CoA C-acetyltransferase [Streptosporangiaceae bacterium]
MNDVVICSPVRTPVGRFGGALKDVPAQALAATVIAELVKRTGVDRVDDVILGQCYPSGEAPAIGRVAALDAGLPVETPGSQLDRRCGSGLQAVINAVLEVASGACESVIAGGAESMSQAEYYATGLRWGRPGEEIKLTDRLARARVTAGGRHHPVPGGMLETAENVRKQYGITREEQDRLALLSHRRAVAAQEQGRFADEIVAVEVPGRHETAVVDRDEHPRADSTLEQLAALRPVRRRLDPESTVTAGNASGQNDGAAVCLVTTRENADRLGLPVRARLVSWAVAGVPPHLMGLGPVPAAARALERAGLALADMDLIELNEAFAAQVLGVAREWGFTDLDADFDRVNVNGSGISLGHPVGATGCRILATLLHEMVRRDARYGLETMCIGGGQGLAAVIERC